MTPSALIALTLLTAEDTGAGGFSDRTDVLLGAFMEACIEERDWGADLGIPGWEALGAQPYSDIANHHDPELIGGRLAEWGVEREGLILLRRVYSEPREGFALTGCSVETLTADGYYARLRSEAWVTGVTARDALSERFSISGWELWRSRNEWQANLAWRTSAEAPFYWVAVVEAAVGDTSFVRLLAVRDDRDDTQ